MKKNQIQLEHVTGVSARWQFRVCDVGMTEEEKPEWGPEQPNLILVENQNTAVMMEQLRWSGVLGTYPGSQSFRVGTGTTPNATNIDGTYSQTGTTVTRQTGTGTFIAGMVGDFIRFGTGETAKIESITSTTEVEVNKTQTVSATTVDVFDTSRIELDADIAADSKTMSYNQSPLVTADSYVAGTGIQTFRRAFQSTPRTSPITYTEFGLTTEWIGTFSNDLFMRIVPDTGVFVDTDQFVEANIALSVQCENFRTTTALTMSITGWPYEYAIQSIVANGTYWDVTVTPDVSSHLLATNTVNIAGALPVRYSITNITSTVSDFTVTAAGHPYAATDSIEIEGATPAGYNGTWTVASVSGNDFTVTDASNLGAGGGGDVRLTTPGTWYNGAHTIASFPSAGVIRITDSNNPVDAGADGTAKGSASADGILQGPPFYRGMSISSASREYRGPLDFGFYLFPGNSDLHCDAQTGTAVTGLDHGDATFSAVSDNIDVDANDYGVGLSGWDVTLMEETLEWDIPSATLNEQDIVQLRFTGEAGTGAFWITFDEPQRKDVGYVLSIVLKKYWEPELNTAEVG